MPRRLALFSLLVPDYDDAIAFFTSIGFECREDTDLGGGKRWVRIAPPGAETEILLARAADDRQRAAIGEQGGGRVWLFLETDDFDRDHRRMIAQGIPFETTPRDEPYGRVAVWSDPWGNRWDLIEFSKTDRSGTSSTTGPG
ncbi:MAG: VOC family protein [Silicimonas sp.]|nr:VOC family protein [Silicimonas sp.]